MRTVVKPPLEEAVSLAEARLHLKIDDDLTDDDARIAQLIVTAREMAEAELCRPLLPQTCVIGVDAFTPRIRLWADVTRVIGVEYRDAEGDAGDARATVGRDRYRLVGGADLVGEWPVGSEVKVTFECGAFASGRDVPRSIHAWMLIQIGGLYEGRQSLGPLRMHAMPTAFVDRLLDGYRRLGV
ncbi:MAG: head-tail connector protein [Janthinobacterium lividum]